MKPDWKDAPDWANWLAMDADGTWYWFEYEPYPSSDDYWKRHYRLGGMSSRAEYIPWHESLESRP